MAQGSEFYPVPSGWGLQEEWAFLEAQDPSQTATRLASQQHHPKAAWWLTFWK